MTNAYLLPLAFLHVDNRREIDGITKFQKLVFLAQQEGDVPEDLFTFQADKYGPFSPELYRALDQLEERGMIEKNERETRSGNERYAYSITNKGRRAVLNYVEENEESDQLLKAAQRVKKRHNSDPLDRILRYVYRKYPDYTSETELDLDELFSSGGRRTPDPP